VLRKLAERGDIGPEERVVLIITGEGLKTLDAVRGAVTVQHVEPTTASVADYVLAGAEVT
jgi:threonine synthase